MKKQEVEAAVGMTRKWDAREAGREVARNTIKKLNSPPNFFLLFSTIHYKDHGGFEEFLNGVWDVLPNGIPLTGGTVLGFTNSKGSYTRGACAMAVSYPHMDLAIGIGKNPKRNPKKAAKKSAEMIKRGLSKSKYKNKFVLNFVSGPELMRIPGQGYKKVIDSGIISKFVIFAYGLSQYLFQKGASREDEVFEETVKNLPDYNILLGTSMDNYKGISHYQFYNHEVHTRAVVNLGIAIDLDLDVCTTHGMKRTDIVFDITKLSKNGHIIHEINNKPAVPELYKLLNWPDGFLNEKTMFHIITYYPISLKRHSREVPAVMPAILKNSILTPCVVDKGRVSIMTISGEKMISSMQDCVDYFENIEPEFALLSACITIVDSLGNNVDRVREILLEYFKNKPFLMFWSAGEGTYSPHNNLTYANMSFNTAIFGTKKS